MEDLNYEETTISLDELLRSIQRGYVKDTTKDRAPVYYQAPDFSSENPEKDFEEGMRIIENDSNNWCEGKKLFLKAAHNGRVRAQFMSGCLYRQALPGFVAYEKMKYGAYLENVNVDVLIKRIKTTNII